MTGLTILCEKLRLRLPAATAPLSLDPQVRHAAVALILRQSLADTELLIIKRAVNPLDHWSGNLALPGGRHQIEDTDLCATAIRETYEEVGIDLSSGGGEVLGCLEMTGTTSPRLPQITIAPFVAIAPSVYHVSTPGRKAPPLLLNCEVEASFWISTGRLLREGPSVLHRLIIEGQEHQWPAYETAQGLIWGVTEKILTGFLALLR